MKKLIRLSLCLLLVGCAHAQPMPINPFAQPQYGMTKQEMLAIMGKPDFVEIYKKLDQSRIEFDIYLRQFKTSQYKLPVCLVSGKVVGWGKSYYEDHITQDDIRIK